MLTLNAMLVRQKAGQNRSGAGTRPVPIREEVSEDKPFVREPLEGWGSLTLKAVRIQPIWPEGIDDNQKNGSRRGRDLYGPSGRPIETGKVATR